MENLKSAIYLFLFFSFVKGCSAINSQAVLVDKGFKQSIDYGRVANELFIPLFISITLIFIYIIVISSKKDNKSNSQENPNTYQDKPAPINKKQIQKNKPTHINPNPQTISSDLKQENGKSKKIRYALLLIGLVVTAFYLGRISSTYNPKTYEPKSNLLNSKEDILTQIKISARQTNLKPPKVYYKILKLNRVEARKNEVIHSYSLIGFNIDDIDTKWRVKNLHKTLINDFCKQPLYQNFMSKDGYLSMVYKDQNNYSVATLHISKNDCLQK